MISQVLSLMTILQNVNKFVITQLLMWYLFNNVYSSSSTSIFSVAMIFAIIRSSLFSRQVEWLSRASHCIWIELSVSSGWIISPIESILAMLLVSWEFHLISNTAFYMDSILQEKKIIVNDKVFIAVHYLIHIIRFFQM